MATTKTTLEQLRELKADYDKKTADLKEKAATELRAYIDLKEKELAALRSEYEELTGISLTPKKAPVADKGKKDEGKPVSIAALTKHLNSIKGQDDKAHNTRKICKALETTSKQVLITARAHPDAFEVTDKAPQFWVNLKK